MSTTPKRHWFRYSLRTLLVLVTVVSAGFGWLGVKIREAQQQKEAVEAIKNLGGYVFYDYEIVDDDPNKNFDPDRMPRPHLHWFQFSLRTMLIVMVLASAIFGYWVLWSREWIGQRQKARENDARISVIETYAFNDHSACLSLRLFGEDGITNLYVKDEKDIPQFRRLFPEATVVHITYGGGRQNGKYVLLWMDRFGGRRPGDEEMISRVRLRV